MQGGSFQLEPIEITAFGDNERSFALGSVVVTSSNNIVPSFSTDLSDLTASFAAACQALNKVALQSNFTYNYNSVGTTSLFSLTAASFTNLISGNSQANEPEFDISQVNLGLECKMGHQYVMSADCDVTEPCRFCGCKIVHIEIDNITFRNR